MSRDFGGHDHTTEWLVINIWIVQDKSQRLQEYRYVYIDFSLIEFVSLLILLLLLRSTTISTSTTTTTISTTTTTTATTTTNTTTTTVTQ